MSTSGMYAKFRTKKSVLNATELVVILGMVASASGVPALVRYPEKTIIIKSTSSILLFRENAAVFLAPLFSYAGCPMRTGKQSQNKRSGKM